MKEYSSEEANAEALRRIDEWAAKADVHEFLDLEGLGLTRLPPELFKLTSLKMLFLGNNRLTALPPEIGQLTNLTHLFLYSNQLTILPPEIGQLTSLSLLHLHANRLMVLPPGFGQLASLTHLNLGANLLTSLPAEFGQLRALESVSIDENRLTTLPPEICELENLEKLFLHNNPLGIPLGVLGATNDEFSKGKKPASARSILNEYFSAHPEVRLSRKARKILAKPQEAHALPLSVLEETDEPDKPESSPEAVPKPFELRHEVVLRRGLTGAGPWLMLFGAMLTAIGLFFLTARADIAVMSFIVFLPIGVPSLLLGFFAARSAMERETVLIQGSPPQVWVRRFRAPKRRKFDDPRVKILLDRRYRASEIEWVSVDVGSISDEGPNSNDGSCQYWHSVIKPKDVPPKKLGTFSAGHRGDECYKTAAEEAGALGQKVAQALNVPFRWDECPAFKDDPSRKYSLYKWFTKKKWDWPWSVPAEPPAKPFWKW